MLASVIWGLSGLACGSIALGIVLKNFIAGAWIIDWAVKISPQLLDERSIRRICPSDGSYHWDYFAYENQAWFEIMPVLY